MKITPFLFAPTLLLCLIYGQLVVAAQESKPVSLSYSTITECFAELKNSKLETHLDLNLLKEQIDKQFITSRTALVERVAIYKDSSGVKKRLRLSASDPQKSVSTKLRLQLDYYDAKDIPQEQILSEKLKLNPAQKDINELLATADFESDRFTYIDTKLNKVHLTYRRNFEKIELLNLQDSVLKRKLICDLGSQNLILCECIKK